MNRADSFYRNLGDISASPFVAIKCTMQIDEHIAKAQKGDRNAESMLCAWIGSIRKSERCLESLPRDIQNSIRQAAHFLKSVGRVLRLQSEDPREWISQRDGSPRW